VQAVSVPSTRAYSQFRRARITTFLRIEPVSSLRADILSQTLKEEKMKRKCLVLLGTVLATMGLVYTKPPSKAQTTNPCADCSTIYFSCNSNCNASHDVCVADGNPTSICDDARDSCLSECGSSFESCEVDHGCGAPGSGGGGQTYGYNYYCLQLYRGFRDQCNAEGSLGDTYQWCMSVSGDQEYCCQQQYLVDVDQYCYGCIRDSRNPECVSSP
jgi:hypothetical protein